MRIIGGLIVVFILSVIFSYFQGFVDFLINVGIIPDNPEYRNANFDIFMIFIMYALFMTTAFIVGGIVILFGWFLDFRLTRKIKKAKKKALKEFGTTLPYFYFIDPKYKAGIMFHVTHYVYHLCRDYLWEKYGDFHKAEEIWKILSNEEIVELYHEARNHYGIPEMPEEYEVLDGYVDEEVNNVC